jgi:hypothetical protein
MPWFVKLRVIRDERLGEYSEVYNARRLERYVTPKKHLTPHQHTILRAET